jgi:hypothetical protein
LHAKIRDNMRRPKLTRPTTDLFHDGITLDVNDLDRRHAFSGQGMWFPFRRLKTFPDHVEINFRDRSRSPLVLLIERTNMHFGGSRPWFVCACGRRCGKLYVDSLGARCRLCAGLQYLAQRQFWTTRLKARAEKICSRLDTDKTGKPSRPRYMHETTYRRHIHTLHRIEHALSTASPIHWIRSRDHLRLRGSDGRYCD